MKKIEAIIQPHRLEAVQAALFELGVSGMTLSDCRGSGRAAGHHEMYRGVQTRVNFSLKVKLELIVSNELCEKCIDAITTHARTGKLGDGKVWVMDLETVVRIRTNERGNEAI